MCQCLQISLESFMLPCPTKTFLGIDCPGCGMQRSLVHLFQGEWIEAFWMYPGLFPMMLMGVAVVASRFYPVKALELAVRWSAIASVTLVLLNFFIKLLK